METETDREAIPCGADHSDALLFCGYKMSRLYADSLLFGLQVIPHHVQLLQRHPRYHPPSLRTKLLSLGSPHGGLS